MDAETPNLLEPSGHESAEWEIRLAQVGLMELSTADLDEASSGPVQLRSCEPQRASGPRGSLLIATETI
jgi:hypothetical protein